MIEVDHFYGKYMAFSYWHINIGLLTAVGFLHLGALWAGMYCYALINKVFGQAWMLLGLRFTRDCRVGKHGRGLVHGSSVACPSMKNRDFEYKFDFSIKCMTLDIYRSSPLQDLT